MSSADSLVFYFQSAAAPMTPTTIRGAWDDTHGADQVFKMDAAQAGDLAMSSADTGSVSANQDILLARFVTAPLAADMSFYGGFWGVIAVSEQSAADNAYLHVHLFVLQGQTDTLRGTLYADLIDGQEVSSDTLTAGQGFSGTMTEVEALAGDTVVLEVGMRCSAAATDHMLDVFYGGTGSQLMNGGSYASGVGYLILTVYAPEPTLVAPTDGGSIQGPTPTFVFGTTSPYTAGLHAVLQVSAFADFRTLLVDTDSTTDYADWEEAADPFTVWSAVGAGGATVGNRMRYAVTAPFRYDTYYGRILLKDANHTGTATAFDFIITVDSTVALSVSIDGTAYNVTVLDIAEETGGEASTFTLEITLSAFMADPLTQGDVIAITSGIGGHGRSWNGTVEDWDFDGGVVRVFGLADDAYLSRKICTGDENEGDLGQNIHHLVDAFGAPLTPANVDVSTGLDLAVTGGYKTLREHCDDAVKALPGYVYWVDTSGDLHFVDSADLTVAIYEVYEEDPSA